MRKLMTVSVMAFGVMLGTVGRADAWSWGHTGPWPQSAAFPCVNPPGWYTNTYSYAWQYPWFAYYNYSHGPYANWMAGGGFATYRGCGNTSLLGVNHPSTFAPSTPVPKDKKPADKMPEKKPEPGKVTIELPSDAKLLFNGMPASGTGSSRTFATPPLEAGQDYGYELTAEIVRDGRTVTVTERVIVRAGETASVKLVPGNVVTASAK